MNEKVQNTKTEVPKSINMNDCDYLNDMLETEKNMGVNLCIALNEASNNELYEEIFDFFEDVKEAGRDLYELAFKKGWYSLEKETPEKISTKYNELQQKYNDLETSN